MATVTDFGAKRKHGDPQSPPADAAAEHDRPATSSDDFAEVPPLVALGRCADTFCLAGERVHDGRSPRP